jgi:hypothetical protein
LPDAPVIALTLICWAVGLATFQDYTHTSHTSEPPQEVLIQIDVIRAHDYEHLGIRK